MPDGGWYDEDPPKVISANPADKAVNVKQNKVSIYFDEYIKVENATENVIVSPPQLEQAEIKTRGKSIVVELKDTLKDNITYTIDFSDAISDNNEGNPLGNYTYSFSTGESIDTLEVGGYVLEAETLEPIKGVIVGLYDNLEDSVFTKEPMLRVARTDETGHFVIKGVKEGQYRIYALKDMDNNFMLTPNSGETMAFSHELVIPGVFDDVRQDTTWLDSLRIKSIDRIKYKHFTPDDFVLRAFNEKKTDIMFLKKERLQPECFSLIFTYGDTIMPTVRGLNFDSSDAFLVEKSLHSDTLTYWLKDTALVNTDSLDIELTYRMTDTLGVLQQQIDTLQLLPKVPYLKRLKDKQKVYDDWMKKQLRLKKRGEDYDSIMPPTPLAYEMRVPTKMAPDKNVTIEFKSPLATIDSTKVHLYIKRDTLWYNAEWEIRHKPGCNDRTMELRAEWQPEMEYSLELDSAAFTDIYGVTSGKEKKGIRVRSMDEFGSLRLSILGFENKALIVQLLESGEKLVKEVRTHDGVAQFYYVDEKGYYVKLIVDENDNGLWDTGNFAEGLQPEEVYYYPKRISCRAKWDIKESWNPKDKVLFEQKPGDLKKAGKSTKRRTQQNRNLQRAQKLGIELPEKYRR